MIKIPNSSVAKNLKNMTLQVHFTIKNVKKATKTTYEQHEYSGDLYIGNKKIRRISRLESMNAEDFKKQIKKKIVEIIEEKLKV